MQRRTCHLACRPCRDGGRRWRTTTCTSAGCMKMCAPIHRVARRRSTASLAPLFARTHRCWAASAARLPRTASAASLLLTPDALLGALMRVRVSVQLPDLALFGVYDGHGGDSVAHYTARNFRNHLVQTGQLTASMAPDEVEAKAKAAFEIALMAIDKEMSEMEAVESGHDQSGSTSVMTLISTSHIVCANTGDSRAVMSCGGTCVELSHDHKPYNPKEKERIEKAGGQVKFNRVNGDLAVSRALGDFVYKRCATAQAEEQAVTAFPEIISQARSPQDEFIVLACDGIWDVMSSAEVVDKVREMLVEGRPAAPPLDADAEGEDAAAAGGGSSDRPPPPPPRPWDLGAVCECLIDHCLRLGSRDNMSVIIVLLNPALAPKPEGAGGGVPPPQPLAGSAAAPTGGAAAGSGGAGAGAGAATAAGSSSATGGASSSGSSS